MTPIEVVVIGLAALLCAAVGAFQDRLSTTFATLLTALALLAVLAVVLRRCVG
jgi:hypothetical protein